MFAEILVEDRFIESVSYIKPIPSQEKIFAVGKSGPNATFNLFFLGSGWPWVGEFVGFIKIFKCFPTQQDLANHLILPVWSDCFWKILTTSWTSAAPLAGASGGACSGTPDGG